MFSTNAFSGIITLPVSRNSTANMITAMSPSTTGNRDVMASTLSRLTCAVPANSTSRPPGPWTACRPSSWASEDSENSGAVLRTVRYALPPATRTGDTPATSGTRARSVVYRLISASVRSLASGTTMVTAVAESSGNPVRISSPT